MYGGTKIRVKAEFVLEAMQKEDSGTPYFEDRKIILSTQSSILSEHIFQK